MRVGFDTSPLGRPHSAGVERATRGLVDELERRGRIEVVRLAPAPGEPLRSFRHKRLAQLVAEHDLVGLHSPVSAFSLRGPGRRVQTVHELPWKHGVDENSGVRHRAWARLGRWRADAVLCPSERTARDLTGGRDPATCRVHVCPWGIAAPFEDEPPLGAVDEVVLGRYRLGEDPLALALGAVRPKKNLAALLKGLAELRARNGPRLHLVVTGADTPQLRRDLGLVSRLGLSRWVSTPGNLPPEDLPALLRLAAVVPVLSKSEGFSFPTLEALACGTPVVVPEDSAQSELAGPLGIAVDPNDPASVASGLERAVLERHALQAALTSRASTYSWERCARQVEDLWLKLGARA